MNHVFKNLSTSVILMIVCLLSSQIGNAQNGPMDLFPIKIGSGYGYMNRTGRRIIRAEYDSAHYFYNGLAAVKYHGKWGFINSVDSFVISPIYMKVTDFSNGLAGVRYKSPEGDTTVEFCGYLKPDGHYAIPLNTFQAMINNYSDGRILMQDRQQDWYYYLADKSGKKIYKFDAAHIPLADTLQFHEGKMPVLINMKKRGYIDTMGNNVFVTDDFMDIGNFHEGLAQVRDGNMNGYIDTLDHTVIPTQYYDVVGDFHEGLAFVKKGMIFSDEFLKYVGGKTGYMNHKGEIAIDIKFDDAGNFSEGLAKVKIGNKWGYIDKTGNLVIPAIYDQAGDFFRELAPVRLNGEDGYITGKAKFLNPKVKQK